MINKIRKIKYLLIKKIMDKVKIKKINNPKKYNKI